MQTPEINDDEFGRDLTLRGIVHEVIISEPSGTLNKDTDYVLFVNPMRAPNGFNLTREDCKALYSFLEKYVKE